MKWFDDLTSIAGEAAKNRPSRKHWQRIEERLDTIEKGLKRVGDGLDVLVTATGGLRMHIDDALKNLGDKITELSDQAKELAQVIRDNAGNPAKLEEVATALEGLTAGVQGAIDATKDVDPTP